MHVLNPEKVLVEQLKDDGTFPNNPDLPLLVYRSILPEGTTTDEIEGLIRSHGWGNDWRNGIFSYHYYHSTAHELLLVYAGVAEVQLGGPKGILQKIHPGDAILLPAGTAHKKLRGSADFACIGAYPPGQIFDMNYGKTDERPRADENIRQVALPDTDPVYGEKGPLLKHWRKQ